MSKSLYRRFVLASLFAVVIVSYTEKWQVATLMPIRNALLVPEGSVRGQSSDPGLRPAPLKASRDGYYINPWEVASRVSEQAADALNSGCRGNSEDNEELLFTAKYFTEHVEYRNIASVGAVPYWPYPIHYNYGVSPGWVSGMVQARVALVLAGAAECSSGDQRTFMVMLARDAVRSLSVVVEEGGVSVNVRGGLWFEEYAQPSVNPPLVLNGHVYALLSLDQLSNFDERADALFLSGLSALIENLPQYDAGTWSYYDSVGTPANNIYQQALHARQMGELHQLTGERIFLDYQRIFSLQRLSPFSSLQRLLMRPSRFLVLLLVLDTFAVFLLLSVARAAFGWRSSKARR